VYARNLKKECAGLVAGQAVLTAEIRTPVLVFGSRRSAPWLKERNRLGGPAAILNVLIKGQREIPQY
jgi:hypothetical protein